MVDQAETYEGPERRETGRFPTHLTISLRETGHAALPGTVTSLSHLGCTVECVTLHASEQSVWIRLPGLESQLARRRWATNGAAGFVFERPLYPPVAERYNGQQRPVVQRPALSIVRDEDTPVSRREQILKGFAEVPPALTLERTPRVSQPTLGGMVRRHTMRVVDHRQEPRFPPPKEAQMGFRVADERPSIRDISSSGVQVEAELEGGIGGPVKVAFAGYEPLEGKIVWVRQGATGVRLPDNALDLTQDN